MVSTYGTWLPGDHRGWHERNHHEHVAGDYKSPPTPTTFSEGRLRNSRTIMNHDPFLISPPDRERIGLLLLESFQHQKVPVAVLAVAETNFHALIRYPGDDCRLMLGRAKAHVMFRYWERATASTVRRPIWGSGSLPKPIRNEAHGHKVFKYILDHKNEGAWTWSHRSS
jgi:hypothetical protein